jgi:Domain of unknown function (DUF5071)
MSSDPIQRLPESKYDVSAAEALIACGYPSIQPVLPQLLEWIQDGNWPVARVLAPFLATVGADLVPHAQRILHADDDAWKYFLLQDVVAPSPELRALLRPELEHLAYAATPGEVAEGLPLVAEALLPKK